MKTLSCFLFALGSFLVTEVLADSCADPSQAVPVYRDFNDQIGDHFYTTNNTEYTLANAGGYFAEGARFRVFSTQVPSTEHLLRLWNGGAGDHFFTLDTTEATNAVSSTGGYVLENLAPMFVYSSQICGTVPLLRYWSAGNSDHFYTISTTEVDNMPGYSFERIEGYVLPLVGSSSSATDGSAAGTGTPGSPAATTSPPAKTNAAVPMPVGHLYFLLPLALAVAYL
ncbi:Excalibur calcium-binding domain-containing protein [Mycena venus]|uniref:Excalibur calcium-binding domain-containing protein n=1 Tax=Mycena venus TaxID=2733690 RepID=A0A8H7DBN4_9AGAR|nr:Excalibur calcium-binding domain-containing protein [Mycena venus]